MSANLSMMQAALIDSLMLQELQGESIVGDLLSAGIWTWFARADVHTRDMERTNGVLAAQGGSYGLLHVALHPTSAWGVVKNVTFPGVSFDVAHVRIATAASDASVESWKSFNRSHGSYLSSQEHALLEEIFSDPSKCNSQSASVQDPLLVDCPQGISSVRALSLASQTGQKVFTITAGTFSSNPRFVSENLSAHSDAMREKVEQALLAGFDVTVHDAPIASQGWTGAGFVITDPASGSGGYLLDGGANGGWLSLVTNAAGALVVITLLVGKLQAAGLIAALSAPFGFYLLAFGVLAITAFVMAEYFYGGYTYDCDGISTCHYPENIAKMGLFATTMKLIQAGLSGNLMALVAGLLLLAEIVKGKA